MRAHYLDALRGIAVVWMIIFHASYDMKMLGYIDWNFTSGFWYFFPRVIAFTFLFCVGISLNFSHTPKIKWNSLKERSIKLFAGASTISLATYIIFPSQWIYFGTLHCIFFGSILGAVLANHRKMALTLLILIIIGQYALDYDIKWISSILKRPSMDFIPIYPWFWVILAGLLIGPKISKMTLLHRFPDIKPLSFLGRHSLKIYLVHQPIIYGILWSIKMLSN